MNTCPPPSALALWLGNMLTPEEADGIARHVEACPRCGAAAEQAGRTHSDAGPPSFALLLPLLREAFYSSGHPDADLSEGELSGEWDGDALAAESAELSQAPQIPPFFSEAEGIVVRFRFDPVSSTLAAHLVGHDPATLRFRPLRLNGTVCLTDASGECQLTGLSAEDALGLQVQLPPLRAQWTLAPPEGSAVSSTQSLPLPGAAAESVGADEASCTWSAASGTAALRLEVRLRLASVFALVAVRDEISASMGDTGDARLFSFELPPPLPAKVRLAVF